MEVLFAMDHELDRMRVLGGISRPRSRFEFLLNYRCSTPRGVAHNYLVLIQDYILRQPTLILMVSCFEDFSDKSKLIFN